MRFSGTPLEFRLAAARAGQHTDEVLKKLLGKSDAEIAKLRADECSRSSAVSQLSILGARRPSTTFAHFAISAWISLPNLGRRHAADVGALLGPDLLQVRLVHAR